MLSIAAIVTFVAAGAGIGGGGVLLPVYTMIGGFHMRSAVALSNITIFGAALANAAINIRKRHPVLERPMIDWDLILMMEPATIVGAIAGTYINVVLPGWLTALLLSLLLSYISMTLLKKGRDMYMKESAALREVDEVEQPLLLSPAGPGSVKGDSMLDADGIFSAPGYETHREGLESQQRAREADLARASARSAQDAVTVQEILREEKQQLPPWKVSSLLLLAAWVVVSDNLKAAQECGSPGYWVVTWSVALPALLVTALARSNLLRSARLKRQLGLVADLDAGEIHWTPSTTLLFPLICSSAGLVAGAFGVGGGIIKGPMMLELGVLPEVAAATSATMIFFTASTASICNFGFGLLNLQYGAALALVGFFSTLGGQGTTHYLMARLQRRSIIIFIMAVLLMSSTVTMYFSAAVRLSSVVHEPDEALAFGSICDN